MGQANTPHLALPVRVDPDGTFAVVEQDTGDDVRQCVEVLFRTTPGQRIEIPEYGMADLLFAVRIDEEEILGTIDRWEPRAIASLDIAPDLVDEMIRRVRVSVQPEGEPT